MTNLNDFNQRVMAEFRANGGRLGGSLAASPILLLTTTGAKSGTRRTTPLSFLRDGERFIVTSSHGGAPTHSGWFYNLQANANATIEVGAETVAVTAVVLAGEERDRLFAALAERVPTFIAYQAKTTRRFPVVALEPQQN